MAPCEVRGDITASTAEKMPSTRKVISVQARSRRVPLRFAAWEGLPELPALAIETTAYPILAAARAACSLPGDLWALRGVFIYGRL